MSALTCCRRLFADRQVGALGQTVQVPLQDVPAHLIVEGEPELGVNLEPGTQLTSVFETTLFQDVTKLLLQSDFSVQRDGDSHSGILNHKEAGESSS